LHQVNQITDNDIGTRNSSDGRHHGRLRLAVNKLVDLDRLHRGAGRDFSNDGASIGWPTESIGKLF